MGIDQVGDFDHIRAVFKNPIITGDTRVQHAVLDVPADFLRADEPALEFRVVDAGHV
jgi:hypothetical protein